MEDLRAYVAGDRRRAIAEGRPLPTHVSGSGLFADISGFTPLTEALADELGPRRGAEVLASNLDRIFEAIIDDLHAHGGEVLYFSGDAVTCWLDGDDGLRATACALAMQDTMARVGEVTTPLGTVVKLAVKVAVAVGNARRFVVGDPEIQLLDVLAGRLIDKLAAAEQLAQRGEVVLEDSALSALEGRVVLGEQRVDLDSEVQGGVVSSVSVVLPRAESPGELDKLGHELARPWLLPTVHERLTIGGGAFFAELRSVVSMFIRFGGFDYDDDPDAEEGLDFFIRSAQQVLNGFGGNLLQLTLGDKGAYLYAVFGSPRAHEDDAARATSAALELRKLDGSTGARDIQIGIATGRVFSGTYGHPLRRTFTCFGDSVNLAARLMSKARPGEVYGTAEVVRASGDRFNWHELGPMALKGKTLEVVAHGLVGTRERVIRRHLRYPLPMVGRERELAVIEERLADALTGQVRVVGISAEAGIGKSRLVAEIVRSMRAAGLLVAFGEADAIGKNTSYLAWREVWRTLFDLGDQQVGQAERVVRELARVAPKHVQRAPLLSGVLGVDIPDNELTAAFDPKLRKASLENLLGEVLRFKLAERPIVVVLEDTHWIDPSSVDLLEVLIREASGLPLFVAIAYRPEIGESIRERFHALTGYEHLELRELGPEAVTSVIEAKFRQQFGEDVSPVPAVTELITAKSDGNPFYVEELVNYLRRQALDPGDPTVVDRLELPDSLNALVLSRIDALDQLPRRTLKTASVVGREFDLAMLPGIFPDLGSLSEIAEHLEALQEADLVTKNREDDDSWLFRHAVTREVAYEGMPFAFRATLHEAAGVYIEQIDPATIDLRLDLLAHHFWLSGNLPKKVEYLSRAGESAKASYSNQAAIDYFERLATIVDESERAATLLKLGEVLELVGDWPRAEQVETEALALAGAAGDRARVGWCEAALAEVARKQGRFDDASDRLERALAAFDDVGDAAGKGRVLHLMGTVAAQHGELDQARDAYEASLEIRQELGDRLGMAALLSNLGIVAAQSGDIDGSDRFHKRALDLRETQGDRWAIGVSDMNLGMNAMRRQEPAGAAKWFTEAERAGGEVGDTWMVALSRHNLGNTARALGDSSRAKLHFARGLEAFRDFGDRWASALLLEDLALLAADTGDAHTALWLIGAADRVRRELSTPRVAALEDELRKRVAGLGLPSQAAGRARAQGEEAPFEAAVAKALEFCRD